MQIPPTEETQIVLSGSWDSDIAQKISNAWFSALAIEHKLPEWIRYMPGMSGKKYRYLINNLISQIENARYLEIGSWKGSTAASAIYGNKCKALCIDNWSEFVTEGRDNVKSDFERHLKAATENTVDFDFMDTDFRKVDYNMLGKFNIYMYDGPHSEQDQYDGVIMPQSCIDNEYILIVDDWNGPGVRAGTHRAIKDLNHKVVCSIEIMTRFDDQHPVVAHQYSDWHNGYFIAYIKKFT